MGIHLTIQKTLVLHKFNCNQMQTTRILNEHIRNYTITIYIYN